MFQDSPLLKTFIGKPRTKAQSSMVYTFASLIAFACYIGLVAISVSIRPVGILMAIPALLLTICAFLGLAHSSVSLFKRDSDWRKAIMPFLVCFVFVGNIIFAVLIMF